LALELEKGRCDMPAPKHIFDPPFNIIRSSHVTLGVADLARSRAFYEGTLGLHVEDATRDAIYLRGVEERQHHSLVLQTSANPAAHHQGFKVGSEEDLDKAVAFFKSKSIKHVFVERPYQGRTLQAVDPLGMPLELYFKMEKREILLQQYAQYKGVQPQRLDHFNIFAPDLQGSLDFYASLGFRLTEYAEEDGPNGRIAAAWTQRKGNVEGRASTISPTGCRQHSTSSISAMSWRRRGICPISNAAPAGTVSPTRSFYMCVAPTAIEPRFIPPTTKLWIPTTSRSGGRCAIRVARHCGASQRQSRGSRKGRPSPAARSATRCSKPTSSSPTEIACSRGLRTARYATHKAVYAKFQF
jgi:catechol 2,3-dioxygenase-like lactoylglutathione lyase family enzyme